MNYVLKLEKADHSKLNWKPSHKYIGQTEFHSLKLSPNLSHITCLEHSKFGNILYFSGRIDEMYKGRVSKKKRPTLYRKRKKLRVPIHVLDCDSGTIVRKWPDATLQQTN